MKKEFMKRVMAAGMVAAMALTTVACGGSADNSASTDKAEAPAEDAAPCLLYTSQEHPMVSVLRSQLLMQKPAQQLFSMISNRSW